MNERYEQLMAQAWIEFAPDAKAVTKRFAELIVGECMEVASPNYMNTPEDSAYYVELAIDRIADHFGVEE
jgi:hypothetical protein